MDNNISSYYGAKYNTYVGARYVPKIVGDWDSNTKYEPLTVVLYQGSSYTSKTFVPKGVFPTNEQYWAKTGDYNAQVEQYRQDTLNLIDTVELNTKYWVNPEKYGAKFDGVTDDSRAIEEAIKHGNVKFPYGKTVVINNTVLINNPQRIVDFNECYLVGDSNTMFQLNTTEQGVLPLINVTIKNAFVNLLNGASFLTTYDCYFIQIDNIRISGLNGSGHGIQIWNGFNYIINNVNITGKSDSLSNVSGNNATGIEIGTKTPTSSLASITNITNISISNCLIQKCFYGIKLTGTVNATFDSNYFNNLGFSTCDYALYTNLELGSIWNLAIDMIRAEFCGVFIKNNKNVSIGNAYVYHNENVIENLANTLSFFGDIMFFGETGKNVILSNLGTLSFAGVNNFYRSNYGVGDTINGVIFPSDQTVIRTGSVGADPFITSINPITSNVDFATVNNFAKGRKIIFKGTGTIYNIPGLQTIPVHDGSSVEIWQDIDGSFRTTAPGTANIVQRTYKVTEPEFGFDKYNFPINKATTTITQLSFTNPGVMIVYSDVPDVQLRNGGARIKNFPTDPINLYNNPIMIISDGAGNGYIVKTT